MLCLPGFGTHANTQNLPHFRAFPASIQEHFPPKCLFFLANAKLPNRPGFALLRVKGGGVLGRGFSATVGELDSPCEEICYCKGILLEFDTSLAIATSGLGRIYYCKNPPSENPPFDFPD